MSESEKPPEETPKKAMNYRPLVHAQASANVVENTLLIFRNSSRNTRCCERKSLRSSGRAAEAFARRP